MKAAVIGGDAAGLTIAWLLSLEMETHLYEATARLGGSLGSHVFSYKDRIVQAERGETYYFLPQHHKVQSLMDYLNIYTEPRAAPYLYYDHFTVESLPFRGLRFHRFAPFVNQRISRGLMRFAHKTRHGCVHGYYPTNLMFKQYLAGLGLQAQVVVDMLPSLMGMLWHYPHAEALVASAETYIRFLDENGMLQMDRPPAMRFLPHGFDGYIHKMLFKGRFFHHLNHPIRQVRREENAIRITNEARESVAYNQVILSCPADEALSLLNPISDNERSILETIQYASLPFLLHQDSELIPRQRQRQLPLFILQPYRANREIDCAYHINLGLMQDSDIPLHLSAQCAAPPKTEKILLRGAWRKPQNTRTVHQAMQNLDELQGKGGIWYCGSHTYSDTSPMTTGIGAALAVAEKMKLRLPFRAAAAG